MTKITINKIPEYFRNRVISVRQYLEEVDIHNILPQHQLEFTDINHWKCESSKLFKLILVSETALEILWRFSHSYYNYYKEVCEGVKLNGQSINLTENENLKRTLEVLRYGSFLFTKDEKIKEGEVIKMERELPDINQESTVNQNSPEFLFEMFFAFYYIHEIGHIVYNIESSSNLDEEYFCDDFAINILLENETDAETRKWKKRGVALGLIIINIYGMHTGFYDGKKHPKAYERIYEYLDKISDGKNDDLWNWVIGIFSLHMTQNNIKQPLIPFDNLRDAVKEYIKILKNHDLK